MPFFILLMLGFELYYLYNVQTGTIFDKIKSRHVMVLTELSKHLHFFLLTNKDEYHLKNFEIDESVVTLT